MCNDDLMFNKNEDENGSLHNLGGKSARWSVKMKGNLGGMRGNV